VNSSTKRGKTSSRVEVVKVLTCEGEETKSCGEFVYLGSKIITSASATPEIRRRIGMAQVSFGKLWRIWRSKKISTRLKAALYRAIVLYHAVQRGGLAHQGTRLEGIRRGPL
jgi:hypothetical protein